MKKKLRQTSTSELHHVVLASKNKQMPKYINSSVKKPCNIYIARQISSKEAKLQNEIHHKKEMLTTNVKYEAIFDTIM